MVMYVAKKVHVSACELGILQKRVEDAIRSCDEDRICAPIGYLAPGVLYWAFLSYCLLGALDERYT